MINPPLGTDRQWDLPELLSIVGKLVQDPILSCSGTRLIQDVRQVAPEAFSETLWAIEEWYAVRPMTQFVA